MSELRKKLNGLVTEIESYERFLDDPGHFRINLNKEDYYRLIDHCKYLLKQKELTQEDINELKEKWCDEKEMKKFKEKKSDMAEPKSFLVKEKYHQHKREKAQEDASDKNRAIIQHFFAGISLLIGLLLWLFTNFFPFLFILFSALLLIKECRETENITVVKRDSRAYLFSYTHYAITMTVLSVALLIYLIATGSWISAIFFGGTMTFLLVSLSSYDRQIFAEG